MMYLLIQREEVELVPQFLFYSGQRELHQFSVTKVATAKIGSRALFIVTFKRKFAYNVISVYLPSSTIFIICLVTMFVHIKHVEATIMAHLTAMVVMYTLFQAVSVRLPQVGWSKPFFQI